MLRRRRLLDHHGITLDDVACRHRRGRGDSLELAAGHMLVFVRRGCFVRDADGARAVFDPTLAYFASPGDAQRIDHPHEGGDDCTAIGLSTELVASIYGGDPALPSRPLPTSPQIDLEHRLLLAASRGDADPGELVERAIGLATVVLERVDPDRVHSGRPSTARDRAAIADAAREALAADPGRSLLQLAGELAVSPHHLSRIFRARIGHTIARHRMRLRARTALEHLAGGERDLARLAAEVGFTDQSHLCRVIRAETGRTPGVLRALVAP